MTERINLVFMGGFTYPYGMAGTKRIQNAINALKIYPEIAIRVLLQRQSGIAESISGVHNGTPYDTVMGNLFRNKMLIALPVLCRKTDAALKRAWRSGHKNVIYFYGPLLLENVLPLRYARRLGYKIVFDINEEWTASSEVARSLPDLVRGKIAGLLSSKINDLAAGVVVISSYLEKKARMSNRDKVPVLYMPISVDMACFPDEPKNKGSDVSLFYAGSFGKKDGLPLLLDAFDRLAESYRDIRLILTGRGDPEAMKELAARTEQCAYRARIAYKGYLDDSEYYNLLNSIDIPCMTRISGAYASAGFPFKLGEFLATGRPVIASRVSDVERFLVHGHNAMLVQAGSTAEFVEAAKFLIEDRESAAAIGERGRKVAESFFDYRRQAQALVEFIESI